MGNCELCANKKTCKRDTGLIFGACNVDYKPLPADGLERMKREAFNEWSAAKGEEIREKWNKYAEICNAIQEVTPCEA